ncbi:MAG: hypothetical protein Q8P50_15560 [Bacillota bacterium]|nr:hypothetical protein [Bacillota bacterium]
MSIWDRISGVDRRIIYILLFITIMLPQFIPVVIPIKVDPLTVGLYNKIETMKPGDVALISNEFSAVMYSEMTPVLHAITTHLFRKGARVIMMATSADGALFNQEVCDKLLPKDYLYGRNIVNFGFVAGYEAAVASLVKDVPKTFPADMKGTQTAAMEVLKGVKTIDDIALVIQLTGGGLGPLLWVRQVNIPFKTPFASVVSSSMLPSAIPYYQAGQMIALLNGLKGGAEYELLIKVPGKATAGMAGQSLGHLFFVLAAIVANVAYFAKRASTPKGGGKK